MKITQAYLISSMLVGAMLVMALWGWMTLPAGSGVPVHVMGLDGRVHETASRGAIWIIPAVALGVLAVFKVVGRRGVAPAAAVFETTLIGVAGVLLVAEATMIWRAGHPGFDVMRPVALSVAALLLVLGNVLGKARHNAVFGLRTPWTLADARVWDKTHRFAGRGMVLGGLALIALAFLVRDATVLGLSIAACTAIPQLAAVAWSARLARRPAHE